MRKTVSIATIALASAILLAACDSANTPAPDVAEPDEAVMPLAAKPAPQFDAELPGSEIDDPKPLLDYWKAAVEADQVAAARRAWRAEITGGGTAPRWSNLSDITVVFGAGTMEGAAGSSYYSLPVKLTGKDVDGDDLTLRGDMVLRRVNNVPGATPDQLSWRIDSIDWHG